MSEKIAVHTVEQLMRMDEPDFIAQYQNVIEARENRRILDEAPRDLKRLQRRVLEARDGIQPPVTGKGDLEAGQEGKIPAWAKPKNPTEFYPKSFFVTHHEKIYRSMVDSNDTPPGEGPESLWEAYELAKPNLGDPAPKPARQEWETDHVYVEGDLVAHYDEPFTCIKAHTSTTELTPYNAEHWKEG